MAAPRMYSDELRERATRMAVELRQDPATKNGAIQANGKRTGLIGDSCAPFTLVPAYSR